VELQGLLAGLERAPRDLQLVVQLEQIEVVRATSDTSVMRTARRFSSPGSSSASAASMARRRRPPQVQLVSEKLSPLLIVS
jgi:hypothetical protein